MCYHLLKIFAQIVMVPSHNKTDTTSDRALISIAFQHLHQQSFDTLQKQSEIYLAFSTSVQFNFIYIWYFHQTVLIHFSIPTLFCSSVTVQLPKSVK